MYLFFVVFMWVVTSDLFEKILTNARTQKCALAQRSALTWRARTGVTVHPDMPTSSTSVKVTEEMRPHSQNFLKISGISLS